MAATHEVTYESVTRIYRSCKPPKVKTVENKIVPWWLRDYVRTSGGG